MKNRSFSFTRRDFMKRAAASAAGLASLSAIAGAASCGKKKKKAPHYNVLFILSDDLRPQLGCYGMKQMKTPNIDRLAARSLVFDRCYCQMAVCAPSRASLFTGLRPDSTRIFDLKTRVKDALPDRITMPGHFKQEGYTAISIGKTYHSIQDDPDSWSETPRRHAGSLYCLPGSRALTENKKRKRKTPGWSVGPSVEAADVPDFAYIDGMLADEAIRKLQELRNTPFFLSVGFRSPHLPYTAPKKYWDLYDPKTIRTAARQDPPEHASEFTIRNMLTYKDFTDIPTGGRIDQDTARRLIHGYYACVSYLDAQVGRVLDELDRLKLREKTIVVLWGDNGYKLGDYGAWGKQSNLELDTRVPLIVSMPGALAGGRHTNALVESVDLFQSLCDLCGIEPPDQPMEGTSFAPLLADPGRAWKKAAFSQYKRGKTIVGHAIRTDRYRYVQWRNTKKNRTLAEELYDHAVDPGENNNCAGDPAYAGHLLEIREQLRKGWRQARLHLQ